MVVDRNRSVTAEKHDRLCGERNLGRLYFVLDQQLVKSYKKMPMQLAS